MGNFCKGLYIMMCTAFIIYLQIHERIWLLKWSMFAGSPFSAVMWYVFLNLFDFEYIKAARKNSHSLHDMDSNCLKDSYHRYLHSNIYYFKLLINESYFTLGRMNFLNKIMLLFESASKSVFDAWFFVLTLINWM